MHLTLRMMTSTLVLAVRPSLIDAPQIMCAVRRMLLKCIDPFLSLHLRFFVRANHA